MHFHKIGDFINKIASWITGAAQTVKNVATNPTVMMLPGAINATSDLYSKLKGSSNSESRASEKTNNNSDNKVFIDNEEAIGKIIEFLEKLSNSNDKNKLDIDELKERANKLFELNNSALGIINSLIEKNNQLSSELISIQKRCMDLEVKNDDLKKLIQNQRDEFDAKTTDLRTLILNQGKEFEMKNMLLQRKLKIMKTASIINITLILITVAFIIYFIFNFSSYFL